MGTTSALSSFIGQSSHSLLGVVPLILAIHTMPHRWTLPNMGEAPASPAAGCQIWYQASGKVFHSSYISQQTSARAAESRGQRWYGEVLQSGGEASGKHEQWNGPLCQLIFHLRTRRPYQAVPVWSRVVREFLRSGGIQTSPSQFYPLSPPVSHGLLLLFHLG